MDGRKFEENARLRKALVHLASIDPIELCNEAKVERCMATRDLRSCGRCVQRILTSCGHAALCEECRQRCDVCPVCRIPSPKTNSKLPFRLYYECIERYRYTEAYQVDCKLQALEEDFISTCQNYEISFKIKSTSHWRKGLVDRGVELLPDVLQQQVKAGIFPEIGSENRPAKSDLPYTREPILSSLLFKIPELQQGRAMAFPSVRH